MGWKALARPQALFEWHQRDNRHTCRGAVRRSAGPQPGKCYVPRKGWWVHYSTYLAPWIPRGSGQFMPSCVWPKVAANALPEQMQKPQGGRFWQQADWGPALCGLEAVVTCWGRMCLMVAVRKGQTTTSRNVSLKRCSSPCCSFRENCSFICQCSLFFQTMYLIAYYNFIYLCFTFFVKRWKPK